MVVPAPCCVLAMVNMTTLPTYTDATCKPHCGPTCYGYGNAVSQYVPGFSLGCAWCMSPVEKAACSNASAYAFSSIVRTPTAADNVPSCTGQTCVLCNNASLDMVPKNAFVYITPSCGHFDAHSTNGSTIVLDVGTQTHTGGLTLFVQDNDTVILQGEQPLSVHDTFAVKGGGIVAMQIASGYSAIVVESKRKRKSSIDIKARMEIGGVSDCAVTYFSDIPAKDIDGSLTFASSVTFTHNIAPVYLAAVANVIGKMSMVSANNLKNASVMVLDVNGGAFAVPRNVPVISVSKLLAVFGTEYEIAYFNDGDLAEAALFTTANKVLLPLSIALVYLYWRNPSFGTGDF